MDGLRSTDVEGRAFATFVETHADDIGNGRSVLIDLIRQGRFLSNDDVIEIVDEDGQTCAPLPLATLICRASTPSSDAAALTGTSPTIANAVQVFAAGLLGECLAVSQTGLGNVQNMDWHSGRPAIRSRKGFAPDFLNHFKSVTVTDRSACAAALRARRDDRGRRGQRSRLQSLCGRFRAGGCEGCPVHAAAEAARPARGHHVHALQDAARPTDLQMQAMLHAARKAADAILEVRAAVDA